MTLISVGRSDLFTSARVNDANKSGPYLSRRSVVLPESRVEMYVKSFHLSTWKSSIPLFFSESEECICHAFLGEDLPLKINSKPPALIIIKASLVLAEFVLCNG